MSNEKNIEELFKLCNGIIYTRGFPDVAVNFAILLSVRPIYAHKIMSGEKTVEIRKRFPEKIKQVKCYIYSSFPEKNIIGEVTISEVKKIKVEEILSKYSLCARIDRKFISDYFGERKLGYVLILKNPIKYDVPLKIKRAPQSFMYVQNFDSPN